MLLATVDTTNAASHSGHSISDSGWSQIGTVAPQCGDGQNYPPGPQDSADNTDNTDNTRIYETLRRIRATLVAVEKQ